jgi:hypothetical protein
MADHEANRIDGTDILLALMNLEIWSRIYLDRRDPRMSPTNSRATSHEHSLHLPPLSVSAQAGRQDPALQHDSPPVGQRPSGDRLFARALAAGSRGRARDRTALRTFRNGAGVRPLQTLRMVARLPLPTPSSMGYFYSPSLKQRVDRLLSAQKWDLIFVHCSSVAQYVEQVRDVPKILDFGDMDSQKWLEYANYKPFPLSLGYRLEGNKVLAAEKRLATRFDLCTATTRAEWETLEGYRTGVATDWFPNGVDAEFFCPSGEPYDPTR